MNKASEGYCIFCVNVLLISAIFFVYSQTLHHKFVNFDDNVYITDNQNVQNGLNLRSIRWAFSTGLSANWLPLTWLSHMLDCQLFGLDPKGHHLVNVIFHTVNTLLLFWVLKAMAGALWQSAFVAALFALHPLHVESVAWAAERKDVLSTLFWLLTIAAYLRYVRRNNTKWYLVSLFLFASGLMAKPMVVTLPFVLLLLDYWPLSRISGKPTKREIYRLALEKLPFFALSVISSIVTFVVQRRGEAVGCIDSFPLGVRIVNALASYMKYIEKTVWPAGLAVFYPYRADISLVLQAAAGVLVLLGVSILVIKEAIRQRYLLVGWLWYLGTLVPVIGLVQVGNQALADRYSYIPLIGLFIIVAWGGQALFVKWHCQKIVSGFSAAAVLFALSVCTYFQLHYWRDSFALFEYALKVTDNNYVAHNNLGFAFQTQGKFNEAMSHYHQALQLKSDDAKAYNNLGLALKAQGKLDEAVSYYQQALRIRPDLVEAHNNLGIALAFQNRLNEAIDQYQQALKIKPGSAEVHNNLGSALQSSGNLNEALVHYRLALRDIPDSVEVNNNLAWILATHPDQKLRDTSQAVAFAEHAAELTKYKNPAVLNTLMTAYAAAGKKELADQIRKKLELYKQQPPDRKEIKNH